MWLLLGLAHAVIASWRCRKGGLELGSERAIELSRRTCRSRCHAQVTDRTADREVSVTHHVVVGAVVG